MFQQAGYDDIAAATHTALSALRQRRLVTFRPPTPKQAVQPAAPTVSRAPLAGRALQAAAANRDAVAPAVAGMTATGALWQPTQMGRAIYESCLPTAAGQVLYDRLVVE
jgi:hypothetical protein